VSATDIRGGMAALLLALTAARTDASLENAGQVLRGYQGMQKVAALFGFEEECFEWATRT
jgi:UDP-N-acetylglucosamine enolpyruvyl transferase